MAFFLFLSLSVYTVLPLSMAWALMVGIWTSVSHIIIISIYVPVTNPKTPDMVVQVKNTPILSFAELRLSAFVAEKERFVQ